MANGAVWDGGVQYVEVKQETGEGPGLAMSGGSISLSPGGTEYLSLHSSNAGPTLAQLNSPPNDDLTVLRTFGDNLDSLNLDLEALTGDLLSQYPVEVKTEYVPVVQGSAPSFSWGRASNLAIARNGKQFIVSGLTELEPFILFQWFAITIIELWSCIAD